MNKQDASKRWMLRPEETCLHQRLVETSVEYRLVFEQMQSGGSGQFLLRLMLSGMAGHQVDLILGAGGCDLDDPAERVRLFAAPVGPYLDVEIAPPAELRRFLQEEDGARLRADEFEEIERSVVSWLNQRYAPPSHLDFRLEYSEILADAGLAAPLEIWLSAIFESE